MGKSEHDLVENDHHCTPEKVWGPIVKHLGPIGLDPMTNHLSAVPAAHRWTDWKLTPEQCRRYGLAEYDAFTHAWNGYGLVFANGPFSVLDKWVPHARRSTEADVQHGGNGECILVVPVRTSSRIWQQEIFPHWDVLFWRGRIKFDGAQYHAPFHVALCYRGERNYLFARAFEGKGLFLSAGTTRG